MTDAAIPIGGSSGLDHESSAAIDQAANWLATTPRHLRPDRPIVPVLRDMFGLSATEACVAIREHRLAIARAT